MRPKRRRGLQRAEPSVMKPVVHLYTICWDEADRLGFFFRHYDPSVDPPGKTFAAAASTSHAAPTVSVVIKAYNHAAYVRQTIESVLSQSFQDFEIVATDDGSTDGTSNVLRSFGDHRIQVEALPQNQGISAAMNAAIARACGRYLAILNSDDWALPGRLQKQLAFLDNHPGVSLVFGLPRFVDEAGEPTAGFNDFRLPLGFPDFSRRTWLRQFFFANNCLCAPTAMVRREAYEGWPLRSSACTAWGS